MAKKCLVRHTGMYWIYDAVLEDGFVRKESNDSDDEPLFFAGECGGDLVQINVDGKWGFANIHTAEIQIAPVWDFAGPFYGGHARIATDASVEDTGYYVTVVTGKQ